MPRYFCSVKQKHYYNEEKNDFGKGLSVKGVMDIGQSSDVSDYNRIAYIKNAMVSWKKGNFILNGGLISTNQFNFQEKFWGYRYIMKSFQDLYKFGSSADLGLSFSYKFAEWISADAIVVNGEGYKKVQKADGLNYGVGVTLTPVKGLQARIYGGINEADQGGYSIFSSVKVSKVTELYARYDNLSSKDDWNIAKDESAAIIGAQFKPCRYVKIAPNLRMNFPKETGADNKYAAYISCYFGF